MRDAIINRVSTRTYQKRILSTIEIQQIRLVLDKYKDFKGPFGNSFIFTLIMNEKKLFGIRKIGTYGVLKNVTAFVWGASTGTKESTIDYGYVFEHLILEFTKLGFDTCWLGVTFNRKEFNKELKNNTIIPAVTSIGHRANKRSIIEKTVRLAAKSNKRLDFDELFKQYNNDEPIIMNIEDPIYNCLDLVRRGPSATNKQPWRIYTAEDVVHFYLFRTHKYDDSSSGYDVQDLDIGIALSHFEIGMKYFNMKYEYFVEDSPLVKENYEYIISIKISK